MEYKIALIHGDGIGPEIVKKKKKVLDKVCDVKKYWIKSVMYSVTALHTKIYCWEEPPLMYMECL